MSSQGPNSGTTFSDDPTVGLVAWSNPSNAQNSDNSYAQAILSDTNSGTHHLRAEGFSFAIPLTATIDGVLAEVERSYSLLTAGAAIDSNGARLVKNGSIQGDNKSWGSFPSSDAYASMGGSSDLWGLTLTPADVNAANFGFVCAAQIYDLGGIGPPFSGRARIDHIRMTIFFTDVISANRLGSSERAMIQSQTRQTEGVTGRNIEGVVDARIRDAGLPDRDLGIRRFSGRIFGRD